MTEIVIYYVSFKASKQVFVQVLCSFMLVLHLILDSRYMAQSERSKKIEFSKNDQYPTIVKFTTA